MANRSDGGWQFDRHIPIAVLAALFIQTSGVVWWAATMTARVDALEKWVANNQTIESRLAKIETQLTGIIDRMDRDERRPRYFPDSGRGSGR